MPIAKIRFGNVYIQDLNNNNRYDKAVDFVTDLAGKPANAETKYKAFSQALQGLHVRTWKGLSLRHASEYLRLMKEAENYSASGLVEHVEDNLRHARRTLMYLPTPYDPKWFNTLYRNALEKGVDFRFNEAEFNAKTGKDIARVKASLKLASSYVAKLNGQYGMQRVFDQARANDLLREAYELGIPEEWAEAGREAGAGYIEATRYTLSLLQSHIQESNRDFHTHFSYDPKEGDRLMIQAYRSAISKGYDEAMKDALREFKRGVREKLDKVKTYIQEANRQYGLGLVFDQAKADEILAVGLLP